MNGVRVYTNPEIAETRSAADVFYSRRENGPYYRWCYEEKQWRVARVSSTAFSPRLLCTVSWKIVPAALRKKMVDHYED
jgi:hypothetical protein